MLSTKIGLHRWELINKTLVIDDFSIFIFLFIYVKSHCKSPEKKTLSIEKSIVPSDSQGIPVIIVEEKICSVYFQQNLNFLIAILQGENENISLQFHCTAALSFSLKSWNTMLYFSGFIPRILFLDLKSFLFTFCNDIYHVFLVRNFLRAAVVKSQFI